MDAERIRQGWKDIPTGEGIDEPARTYAAGMHNNPYDHYRDKVAAMGFSGERMLDAGCGTGTWSFPFAEFFGRVDGIDLAPGRIALARAMADKLGVDNAQFEVGDVLKLPYEDGVFDLVFCYSVVISYIPIATMLAEYGRVLKPGGTLFVGLNGTGWNYYLRDERSKAGDKYRTLGQRGMYNTFIQSDPAISTQAVRARADTLKADPRLARVKKVDHLQIEPQAFFEALEWPELEALGSRIAAECGEDYRRTLADDVIRIMTGSRDTFSHANAGRGYAPEEVEAELTKAGYKDFQWAQEERLFAREGQRFSRGNLFNQQLTTWEFIAKKG